jgi:hypothetical protein
MNPFIPIKVQWFLDIIPPKDGLPVTLQKMKTAQRSHDQLGRLRPLGWGGGGGNGDFGGIFNTQAL